MQAAKLTQTFEGELTPARLNPYTAIPESIQRHFARNTNSVVTLASGHSMMVSQLHATGRRPIHVQEIDEDLVAELRSSGFVIHESDGTIRKADCMLYVQGVEEREYWRAERDRERLMHQNPDEVVDMVEDARRESERAGRGSLFRVAEDRDLRSGRTPARPEVSAHIHRDLAEEPGPLD